MYIVLAGLLVFLMLIYNPLWKLWNSYTKLDKILMVLAIIIPILRFGINIASILGYNKWNIYRKLYRKDTFYKDNEVDAILETWNGIPVYKLQLKNREKRSGAGIVYIHGGGWTIGNVEAYSKFLCNIVKHTEAVVISPCYRKAPEHPFPAAFDDCYYVTSTFMERAEEFGVDAKRIAVSGDSAGGNLAAAVSHKLCNEPSPPGKPALQYLLYPSLQFTLHNLPNAQLQANDVILDLSLLIEFKVNYLGFDGNKRVTQAYSNHGHLITNHEINRSLVKYVDSKVIPLKYLSRTSKEIDLHTCIKASKKLTNSERKHIESLITNPLLAPLYAKDDEIRNLPKTFVLTCSDDVLRDEGILYHERLRKLNVDSTHHYIENAKHGFISFSKYFLPSPPTHSFDEVISRYFSELKNNV